jgi:2-oxoglutarate ferredoxin oxidoreductase subunit delta
LHVTLLWRQISAEEDFLWIKSLPAKCRVVLCFQKRNSYEVELGMGKIIVNRERCKACALCTLACPKKLILFSQEANSQGFYPAELSSQEECTGCALCAEACPDVAIEVWR